MLKFNNFLDWKVWALNDQMKYFYIDVGTQIKDLFKLFPFIFPFIHFKISNYKVYEPNMLFSNFFFNNLRKWNILLWYLVLNLKLLKWSLKQCIILHNLSKEFIMFW